MWNRLGQLIARYPWLWITAWLMLAVMVSLFRPDPVLLQRSEPASLLPPDAPWNQAMRAFSDTFPEQTSQSQVVLVFYRRDGLTPDDRRTIQKIALELQQVGRHEPEPWRVLSSATNPLLSARLDSSDGRSTLVTVLLDLNYITLRATQAVERIEQLTQNRIHDGLTMEITGSAAIGKQHNIRSEQALQRTTKITILAVLLILILVYRSPLGALVPLLSIGLSVYIAFRVLDILAMAGLAISNIERTFTVVLLFGAGTDYALFWIARYREEFSQTLDRATAVGRSLSAVGPAIAASAATTIFGLLTLMSAGLVPFHNSGQVLPIALMLSLLAAITLVPSLVVVMRRAFFWPRDLPSLTQISRHPLWPRVARLLVRHPAVVLVTGLVVLGIPAAASLGVPVRYDSFGEVFENTSAARGLKIVREHFSEAELFSTRLMIVCDDLHSDPQRAVELSNQLAQQIAPISGVTDVWHLGAPLGLKREGLLTRLAGSLFSSSSAEYYFAPGKNAIAIEVMQRYPPMSQSAVGVFHRVEQTVRNWATAHLKQPYQFYAIGMTPYMSSLQIVANRDLHRVVGFSVIVIGLIVLIMIRRVRLSIFMMLATLITYGAAIGLTHAVFVGLLGSAGIDYKIKILVFVIIVAIGQDYNIFLVTRLLEESRTLPIREAVERSIILTGPVISSCGLIMAATLGSLMVTPVELIRQLGFAFAVGILLDTYLVRPLLVPAFYLLGYRSSKRSILS